MGINVLEAEDADMDRIFEITSLSFARNEPLWDYMHSRHWTDAGRKMGAQRFRDTKNSDPHTTYLKAVDDDTGVIMGMAKWNVFNNAFPNYPPPGDYWETEDDKLFTSHMVELFIVERNAAIKESNGNLVSLDILTIDPAYQRRGVGGKLVEWGTKKADEMGVEAVVESSVFGKGLYQKHGFKFIKDVTLSPPEKWAGRDEAKFAWLVRPKQQST